jgi:hypothetical protein
MGIDQCTTICNRIHEHCRRNNWYSAQGKRPPYPGLGYIDLDGIWHDREEGVFDYRGYFDEHGQLQARAITHNPRTGFEFPPATQEQIRLTEKALGIPLLPILRALYTQVANGGFGPAYGITGVYGGYCFGDDGRYQTIDMCTDTNPAIEYMNLAEYESHHGYPEEIELPPNVWPAHFLHFCYEGCGEDVFVDGKSGGVYLAGAGNPVQDGYTVFIRRLDNSLESWLEEWLIGTSS